MGPEKLISGSSDTPMWGQRLVVSFNGAGEINLRKLEKYCHQSHNTSASMGPEKLISGSKGSQVTHDDTLDTLQWGRRN